MAKRISTLDKLLAGRLRKRRKPVTPKQIVKSAEPKAMLDYYELLRGADKPCWFIRKGIQGHALSDICASPKAAWKNAADSFLAFCKRGAT
jgi:hypothetical protein